MRELFHDVELCNNSSEYGFYCVLDENIIIYEKRIKYKYYSPLNTITEIEKENDEDSMCCKYAFGMNNSDYEDKEENNKNEKTENIDNTDSNEKYNKKENFQNRIIKNIDSLIIISVVSFISLYIIYNF